MKAILLLLVTLPFTTIFAQNWELFKSGKTYNFNKSDIHGVRVDSVRATQNETTFYFNRILNDTVYQNIYFSTTTITDITQPNIFGDEVITRNDSTIFKNFNGDQLYLKSRAKVNDSWNFIKTSSFKVIAKIDSMYTDSINGTLDSIKLITFQYYDSLNNPTSNSINNKTIVISKSNSIITSFNIYETPYSFFTITYQKSYSRLFKSINLTKAEVFDYQVGDKYHLIIQDNAPGMPSPDYVNGEVISRALSSNNDTLTVKISEFRETNTPTSTNYSTKTITKTIINPNQKFNALTSKEPILYQDSSSNFNYTSFAKIYTYSNQLPYSSNTYNDRLAIYNIGTIAAFDTVQNSWIIDYNTYPSDDYILEGVAEYSIKTMSPGGSPISIVPNIIYFKKGTETWGTPRLVTGIGEQENAGMLKELIVYPNPASNHITINTSLKKLYYALNSIDGTLIDQGQLKKNNSIDVSSYPNGIYFLRLENDNISKVKKLLINR